MIEKAKTFTFELVLPIDEASHCVEDLKILRESKKFFRELEKHD